MNEEWTCGKGLAASAGLPSKLAEMMTAMAETFAEHRAALNLAEPAGRAEDEAYATLVTEYREIAGRLAAIAQRLESYRDLPMADHDEAAMADPRRMQPYARFVDIQRELVPMLHASVAQGDAMFADDPEN